MYYILYMYTIIYINIFCIAYTMIILIIIIIIYILYYIHVYYIGHFPVIQYGKRTSRELQMIFFAPLLIASQDVGFS